MAKTFKEHMEHPMATLAILAVLATSITSVGIISGAYDAAHTSQVELERVEQRMEENSTKGTCRALKIQIQLAEQAIWQMEQAGQNSQRLLQVRRGLRDYLMEYSKLECASLK